jgi:ethylbenzene dioxygenase subunit beta
MITPEQLLSLEGRGAPVAADVYLEISRFLYREARLLDEDRLRDWYALLSDDVFYWAPLRENRFKRDKTPELSRCNSALFDETKATIDMRLQRLESGMVWAEDPPTRHVYGIGNIEAFATDNGNEYEVHSVFTLYRNRCERDDSTLMGRRRDILRRTDDGLKIAGRLVLLQQSTLLAKNLSVFF